MIWNCTMSAVEWNKKEDLLQEQALRHLRQYVPLFVAFSTNVKSELALLNKIQVILFYCLHLPVFTIQHTLVNFLRYSIWRVTKVLLR